MAHRELALCDPLTYLGFMPTSDVEILMVPGWNGSGPDHWQSRWERNLKTARRIEQEDWAAADKDAWVGTIIRAVAATSRPAVLVAHSLGVIAVAHAALKLPAGAVEGAFLVSAADVDNARDWTPEQRHGWPLSSFGFAPVPLEALPFPSALLASFDDPFCRPERAPLRRRVGVGLCGGGAGGPHHDGDRAWSLARRRLALRRVSQTARVRLRAAFRRPRCRRRPSPGTHPSCAGSRHRKP